MRNNLLTYYIEVSGINSRCIKEIQNNDAIVKSGIKELDKFIGGFRPGEIYFIDGYNKLVSILPDKICVNAYKTYHKNVIFIDGGIDFNPYRIVKYAKKNEIDQKAILNHIYISRVFTIFQLTTLLNFELEQKILECSPKILMIKKFLASYLDSNISSSETNVIMKNNLKKIRELTKKYKLVTILSNLDAKIRMQKEINTIICEVMDHIIEIKQIGHFINFNFLKKNRRNTVSIIEKDQLSLDDFYMAM